MGKFRWMGFMVAALLVTGCQLKPGGGEPQQLDAVQVKALFEDHTVESQNLTTGVTSFTYYALDGSVVQERYWQIRKGQWRVNEQGEICLSMEKKTFKCRPVYQLGDRYYKYRQDNKGLLIKTIRYRQFIPGNAL